MKEENKEGINPENLVKWLSELSKSDVITAGGKGANMAEMWNNKIPVPPAFIITAQAYDFFVSQTGLKQKILDILNKINIEDTAELDKKSREIKELFFQTEMPIELKNEIIESYRLLGSEDAKNVEGLLKLKSKEALVAVRSSATTEDLAEASFAGQHESFLNIYGENMLIESVKKCFASLFTPRGVYYRYKKGFEHANSKLAVIVQRMINSDRSGVIFTINPSTNENNIVIEAVFGLGEGIVSGSIKPDLYVVNKENIEIIDKEVSVKERQFVKNIEGGTEIKILEKEKKAEQVLNNAEIKQLANLALRLEEHYKQPQDIEFAIEAERIFIVQTRAITTAKKKIEKLEYEGNLILKGIPASSGIASGIVRIIKNPEELEKVKKGDILVTKMTNPDMVVAMQRSSAIVTDEGGMTAHAAIVSREMGIPAVVGTVRATLTLHDGQMISVDGTNGRVYDGKIEKKSVEILPIVETKTKIKVIVDLPDYAERAAKTKASAVGLTRIEGIIAMNGKHPNRYLTENKLNEYTNMLERGIRKIAEHFKEVWIRTSDIRSDEYKNLSGASKETEVNPMLGLHGIRAGIKKKEILDAELLAVKKVSDKGFKLGVMIPQVIDVSELVYVKNRAKELKLENVKIGIMVETPAAVMIIEELCKAGLDFISIGSNDLTQYTLAVDRGNEKVQYLYNEMHPAVLAEIKHVIETCRKYNIETSLCGQAGSKKEMVEFLVKNGIDSISVNADSAHDISILVSELEKNSAVGGVSQNKTEILTQEREDVSQTKPELLARTSRVLTGSTQEAVNENKEESEALSQFKEQLEVNCISDYLPILEELKKEDNEKSSYFIEDWKGDIKLGNAKINNEKIENEEKIEDNYYDSLIE